MKQTCTWQFWSLILSQFSLVFLFCRFFGKLSHCAGLIILAQRWRFSVWPCLIQDLAGNYCNIPFLGAIMLILTNFYDQKTLLHLKDAKTSLKSLNPFFFSYSFFAMSKWTWTRDRRSWTAFTFLWSVSERKSSIQNERGCERDWSKSPWSAKFTDHESQITNLEKLQIWHGISFYQDFYENCKYSNFPLVTPLTFQQV